MIKAGAKRPQTIICVLTKAVHLPAYETKGSYVKTSAVTSQV